MAYSPDREVVLQVLETLTTWEAQAGERVLYILSQSLYLDSDLSGAARRHLRQKRLRASRYTPPALPDDALARFLGFDKSGLAHWYLAHEARPYGLLVGYGFRRGVRHLQKIPHSAEGDAWQQLRGEPAACRYDWARWHLSYTLSHVPPDHEAGPYPDSYQLLAPELWQWQWPSAGAAALDMMCRAAPAHATDRLPAAISQLPYRTVLRDLLQQAPVASEAENIACCIWFLQVCAWAQWHRQRTLAAVLADTARLLAQDAAVGRTLLGILQEH